MPVCRKTKSELLDELESLRVEFKEQEGLLKACSYVERLLEESEERFRAVTETAVDAIIVTDEAGRIVFLNSAASAMFGWGPETMGADVSAIIPERHREAHRRGMARYLETGREVLIGNTVELSALGRDGEEFPIELSLSCFSTRKGIFFSSVIRDISRRARLESIKATARGMLRHDLKSPLTGIGGFARLLARSPDLGDKQRQWAEMILELALDTVDLLDLSRDLFKMEDGTYEPALEEADLAEFLREAAAKASDSAGAEGVELRVADAPPVRAMVEPRLVRNLLANLVKNAYEASPRGEAVTMAAGSGDGSALITIHNKGSVPEEVRDRFFEAYATSGKRQGTGLGTHSAQLMAKAQGGGISFETGRETGTTVTVRLPPA